MKKILAVFSIVIVIVIFFFYLELQPVSSDPTAKPFSINQGEGLSTISLRLQNNHLIRNRLVFMAVALKLGLSHQLRAGIFKLSPSQSTSEIIAQLSKGGNSDYWLKIIEGQRLAELSIPFDDSLEGYVFPDSYLVPQDYQPDQIYSDIIKKNFDKKVEDAKIDATNTQMSDAQIITLASILEREGRSLVSKQEIAGVLLNRLSINMALQIDATVQYARDNHLSTKVFWQPLTSKDSLIDSPYNTYKYSNLPPTPICNPGYDAIYAAYHPIVSDYLYYLTGKDNQMHFTVTLAEHNSNIAKYLK